MANTFKIKRSSVEGKQPLTTDLQLGELAINTYDGKLFLKKNNGTDLIVEVGGNQGYYVKNQTGSTITKGTVVKFNGTLGSSGKLLIAPFIANNTSLSEYVMGVVDADIATGGDGFVIDHGKLYNINTSAWADGTILYASASTVGTLTSTQPLAPNNKVMIAAVVHSHATAGILEIRVTPGSKLGNDELVELNGLANGDLLIYDSTDARFENKTAVSLNDTHTHDGRYYTETEADGRFIRKYTGDRTLSTTANNYVELFKLNRTNGAHSFTLATTVSDSGFSVSKTYLVSTFYGETSTYKILRPSSNTGNYTGNDYRIEAIQSAGEITIRATRVSGTTVGTLSFEVFESYDSNIETYTTLSGTGTSTATEFLENGMDADLLDGQQGSYYLDWTNITNKPDPVITLAGDLSGSVTLTDLASGTLTATIAANSVALGTDTTGNYVAGLTAGTGIAVTGTAGEGWSPTASLATVGTAGTYTKVTSDAYGRVTAGTTLAAADIPNLDTAKITTGTLSTARLGSGTADSTTFLRGDNTWAVPSGGAGVSVGTAAPTSPSAGALWWNSEEGKLKIYYNDGNTSQWVDANTGTIGPQGPQGIQGIQGPTGADGAAGVGVPTGGTTGQVLSKSSSTDYATQWITPDVAAGVTEIKITSYSSAGSGTFTRDANCLYAQVIVTGGGGGGGGADSDGTSASASGGGGGAGTAIHWYMAVELGTTATYTVGGGGSAGSTSGGNGGNGGNSTFTPTGLGAPLVANGGGGGTGTGSAYANNSSAFNGGSGGDASGDSFIHTGIDGGYGFGAVSTTTSVAGGNGGASYWGGGANGPVRNTAGATAGTNASINGAGGSGAVNTNSTAGVVGGTGATGEILIIEYLAA